jgi:Flp pilus assembly protein TadG
MKPFGTRRRSGNAMIEFAISSAVLIPCMAGTFQFGFSTYQYNLLECAVSNGARYASTRTFRTLSGAADLDKFKAAVRNMTVYGVPAGGATPVAKGLTPARIAVDVTLSSGLPTYVKVSLINHQVDAVFTTFNFNGKPAVTYPYVGRYAPNESEP